MDETGHADDPEQKVFGMAGFINSVENWELFNKAWQAALYKYKVPLFKDNKEPYFHMREFKTSRQTFETWSGQRIKQDKLYDKLLRVIESHHAVPFGSIISLAAWRALTPTQKKNFLGDPYFFCAHACVRTILSLTLDRPPEETVRVIFSEKKKVKNSVRRIFDELRKEKRVRERISDPIFEDMRKFPALQAADAVAWEMNLEYRRKLYKPQQEPSKEYQRLVKQKNRRVSDSKGILEFLTDEFVTSQAKQVEAGIARVKRGITTFET